MKNVNPTFHMLLYILVIPAIADDTTMEFILESLFEIQRI